MLTFSEFRNRQAPGDGVHFGDDWTVNHAPEPGCATTKRHAAETCGLIDATTTPAYAVAPEE